MKIPTVTFNPKDPWKPMPQRPFILKNAGTIYRYGNRYNVITGKDGTEIIDLNVLVKSCKNPDENTDPDSHIRSTELIVEGKKEYIFVNGNKIPVSEVLCTENDL
jgi:hypothetical protein